MRRNKSCPLYSQLRPQKRIFALRHVRFTPKSGHVQCTSACPLWAIRRHMQCSKQPVNLGAFGQVLGSLTDYNLASADEDDLSVLRSIAPSHHGYIVEINPNGLCFEIGALHPRCHCRKLSLPGLILLQSKLPLRLPARAARQLADQSTTRRVESSSTSDARLRGALPRADVWRISCSINSRAAPLGASMNRLARASSGSRRECGA